MLTIKKVTVELNHGLRRKDKYKGSLPQCWERGSEKHMISRHKEHVKDDDVERRQGQKERGGGSDRFVCFVGTREETRKGRWWGTELSQQKIKDI